MLENFKISVPKEYLQLVEKPERYYSSNVFFDIPFKIKDKLVYNYLTNGLIHLYSFNQLEACNNFVLAACYDSKCAFAYWGAAYSVSLNINQVIIPPDIIKFSIDCYKMAYNLKQNSSSNPIVGLLIDALKYRLIIPNLDIDHPRNLNPCYRDIMIMMNTYNNKMKNLYDEYMDNNEVCVLYASSIMMTKPWKWWPNISIYHTGSSAFSRLKYKDTSEVMDILLKVLEKNDKHIGALHYLIHVVEESPMPILGLKAADIFSKIHQNLGHIAHMPAHIYSRLGMYVESIYANEKAIAIDKKYLAQKESMIGEKLNSYYSIEYLPHNIHSLISDALKMGNLRLSLKYINDLENHVNRYIDPVKDENMYLEHFLTIKPYVYYRFGLYSKILELPIPSKDYKLLQAVFSFLRILSLCKLKVSSKAIMEFNIFIKKNNKFIVCAPNEFCRCGCQKRHGGITNPNFGMSKYNAEAKAINIFTINNSKILAYIRMYVASSSINWMLKKRKKGLNLIKKATMLYESLQYDEPSDFFYPVHETYSYYLYKLGKFKESIIIAKRGNLPNPNNIRLVYINMICLYKLGDKKKFIRKLPLFMYLMSFSDVVIKLNNY